MNRKPRTIPTTEIELTEVSIDARTRLGRIIGIESNFQNGQELPIVKIEGYGDHTGRVHYCRLESVGYKWVRVLNFLGGKYGLFDKDTGIRKTDENNVSGWRIDKDILPCDLIDRKKLISHIFERTDSITEHPSYFEGVDYVISLIERFYS